MQTDRIVLRPRSNTEAMDLGFQLVRANWPGLTLLTLIGLVPVGLLATLAFFWMPVLPLLVLWWFKPSIDRGLLEMLARDLTGRPAMVKDVTRDRQSWWHGGHLASLLIYRFHPARSMVLPVWQLERLTGSERSRRTRSLMHGNNGGAMGLTMMASLFELCLFLGVLVMFSWLIPEQAWDGFDFWYTGIIEIPDLFWALLAVCYAIAIILVEPFYVGGGFGLYLNQRCRLECWDLEPIFRQIAERKKVLLGEAAT